MTTRTNTTKYSVGFHTVNPADLTPSEYNPVARVEKRYISDLVRSISANGQYMPILVDPSLTIIDGHRRHAALLSIGESACAVRVIESDPSIAYAEVNSCSKKLSSNDHMNVYTKDTAAVTQMARSKFQKMEEVIGRDGVLWLASHGGSITVFRQAVQYSKYCGRAEDNDFVMTAIKWQMLPRRQAQGRIALESKIPPAVLLKCILEGGELTLKWGAK